MIDKKNKSVNLLDIWNSLENGKFIIFYKENLDNLKCFLENIKYEIIENNANVVLKKKN